MSGALKKIIVRVIRKRMQEGEDLEEILLGYPRLSKEEKKELREAVA